MTSRGGASAELAFDGGVAQQLRCTLYPRSWFLRLLPWQCCLAKSFWLEEAATGLAGSEKSIRVALREW